MPLASITVEGEEATAVVLSLYLDQHTRRTFRLGLYHSVITDACIVSDDNFFAARDVPFDCFRRIDLLALISHKQN